MSAMLPRKNALAPTGVGLLRRLYPTVDGAAAIMSGNSRSRVRGCVASVGGGVSTSAATGSSLRRPCHGEVGKVIRHARLVTGTKY